MAEHGTLGFACGAAGIELDCRSALVHGAVADVGHSIPVHDFQPVAGKHRPGRPPGGRLIPKRQGGGDDLIDAGVGDEQHIDTGVIQDKGKFCGCEPEINRNRHRADPAGAQ